MLTKLKISTGNKKLIVYIVLIAVTLAVYWQINQYDFVNLDDNVYVIQNRHIQSGITPKEFRWAFSTYYYHLWHPLIWLSFMFDYQLYGLNAGGYHLTNLALHILSTLLLFWLFNRMTGAIWKSAFVAAFFALHPLHVESVAWISERKDVLSAFFWMLTLCLYVYYTEKPLIKRYLLVLFSFICALMSKPIVITLPIIMILLDYWPLRRFQLQQGNMILRQLKEKTPFFILSAVLVIITLYIPNDQATSLKGFSLSSRLGNAPVSFMVYLEKTFWPHDMAIFYPFTEQIPLWQVLGATLLIIIISAAIIVTARRFPYLLVGWLWYAITLVPVIKIIQVGFDSMADRYLYLPSVGIAVMLAWGIPSLIKSDERRKNILFPATTAFLAILAVLTWQQCHYWKNSIALFSHALRVTKDNYLAHNNLSAALIKEGKFEEAIEHCNEIIRIKPYYNTTSYISRGNAYANLGKYQQAIDDFNKSIVLKPDYPVPYFNRGCIFVKIGRYQDALEDFNKAIRLKPDYIDAYNKRMVVYLNQGKKELGCYDAQKACALGNCKALQATKSKGDCP